jgi:tripartite-type tricarboxylate transporter receptor subunit TctC
MNGIAHQCRPSPSLQDRRSKGIFDLKGGGAEDTGRSSAALSITDDLLHRNILLLRAITGNRGPFQRHGNWNSFGVARAHAMKLPRRKFLHLAAGAAALPALSRNARAQTYPARPVRIIVGFSPGGTADIVARLIGQWLSERLGQPFIIENRPGASSNIAVEAVVRASPDGYTLLQVVATNAINATLYDRLNFNFIRDIAPVASIARVPLVMEVNPSVPAKTVPEFIAYAKANPGKISMASAGIGTPGHVGGELFKMMTGVDMLHVPYRGSAPMVTDLLGGQVQAAFDNLPVSIEHISAGKLRALAVTTATRSEALPDVPTVGDFIIPTSQIHGSRPDI